MTNIAILGSTGSIGTQTLDVVRKSQGFFKVLGLATRMNIDLIEKQADEFFVKEIAVFDQEIAEKLKNRRPDLCVTSGLEGLLRIATLSQVQTLVTSLVGRVGLEPTLVAIDAGKDIALANKETLVVAGEEVMKRAREKGVSIRPIDSEHSAIAQCLRSGKKSEVKKIWLTASGGPFRDKNVWPMERLKNVTVEEALNHPTWKMGKKITIDSATLANKGLEYIEAMYLFDVVPEKIEVVVHPQSLVHSAVEFVDGSFIAEMGATDMRRCISYALTGESRVDHGLKELSLFDLSLHFERPDRERFPCLALAEKAARMGQKACAIFNDTNEEAVAEFLAEKIGFVDISTKIKSALTKFEKEE